MYESNGALHANEHVMVKCLSNVTYSSKTRKNLFVIVYVVPLL